jgi:hypothetical protein
MKLFYLAKRKLQLVPAATILVALVIPTKLSGQTITTFDAPGAGTGALQGTYAINVSPSGTIIGFSRDTNNARHGFVRSRDGSFTIFDAPDAGTGNFQGTRTYGINPSGAITGFFIDSSNAAHGYVRSNQGLITVFDAPGAGTGPFPEGTFVTSPLEINPNGAIAGYYNDSSLVGHGFVRDRVAPSPPSMPQARVRELAKVRLASQSAQSGRLQDSTLTRTTRATVFCGIRMASSRRTMFRAPARVPVRALMAGALLRREPSWETTLTRMILVTVSSGIRMAFSLRSILQAPGTQVLSKAPTLLESIRVEPSQDGMLTQQM